MRKTAIPYTHYRNSIKQEKLASSYFYSPVGKVMEAAVSTTIELKTPTYVRPK